MNHSDPFDFLGGLDDDFTGAAAAPRQTVLEEDIDSAGRELAREFDTREQDAWTPPSTERVTFRETCRKCNGRGTFIGYSGRVIGNCFHCQGVGHFDRLTSPATRERARDGRNQRMAYVKNDRRETFAAAHPAEMAWLLANSGKPTFTFPDDMLRAIEDWGDLTERQLAAVVRGIERDQDRAKAKADRANNAPVVSTDKLMAAFDAAVSKGIKRPKMRFDGFVASLAPSTGKNPGAVYLKASGDLYLGKVAGGKFQASRDATLAEQASIVEAMNDPLAAAVAFGRRTGECSCCGRELTNALSIELGIGPICRERFGL